MAQKRYLEPLKYVVGTDITQERLDELVGAVADWFAATRDTKAPVALARQAIQECLDGVTKDGQKWFSAATCTLDTRIKMKCRFDPDTMTGITNASEKMRIKKQKAKERIRKKREAAKRTDIRVPEELRQHVRKDMAFGDDSNALLSEAEHVNWQAIQDEYVKEFPWLDSVNGRAELKLLADMHVLSERHRMDVLQGKTSSAVAMSDMIEKMEKVKRSLGIHPDQIAKRTSAKSETSIGAAVAKFDTSDYRNQRLRWFAEEMIMAWQMMMTPRADGNGYQLDEVGLFGLTKSRVVCCPKCGTRNFSGFAIEEIEAWLIEKGYLKPVEPKAE